MTTKNGTVKKCNAESFKEVRRSGLIAINLDQGDELLSTNFVEKGDDVVLVTAEGQSIRFKESDVREMGRTAAGVRGIKLKKGDYIVNADVVKKGSKSDLLIMSQNGYGKKTDMDEYKTQARGGSGVKTVNVTAKTGKLSIGRVVTESMEELIAISKNSQVIKVEIKTIPNLSRVTQGVRIMKLREGDSVASLTLL